MLPLDEDRSPGRAASARVCTQLREVWPPPAPMSYSASSVVEDVGVARRHESEPDHHAGSQGAPGQNRAGDTVPRASAGMLTSCDPPFAVPDQREPYSEPADRHRQAVQDQTAVPVSSACAADVNRLYRVGVRVEVPGVDATASGTPAARSGPSSGAVGRAELHLRHHVHDVGRVADRQLGQRLASDRPARTLPPGRSASAVTASVAAVDLARP